MIKYKGLLAGGITSIVLGVGGLTYFVNSNIELYQYQKSVPIIQKYCTIEDSVSVLESKVRAMTDHSLTTELEKTAYVPKLHELKEKKEDLENLSVIQNYKTERKNLESLFIISFIVASFGTGGFLGERGYRIYRQALQKDEMK